MNFVSATDCYTLSNGIKIPCIGYGTFKMPEGGDTTDTLTPPRPMATKPAWVPL